MRGTQKSISMSAYETAARPRRLSAVPAVYLSGHITPGPLAPDIFIPDPLRDLAAELLSASGIQSIDPRRTPRPTTPESIFRRDLLDVIRSDLILVLTASTPTYGTCMEWGIAALLGKPIVALDPQKVARTSLWPMAATAVFCDTVYEAVDWIVQWSKKPLK